MSQSKAKTFKSNRADNATLTVATSDVAPAHKSEPEALRRFAGRAQCGGGARRSAPEPEHRSELRERGAELM